MGRQPTNKEAAYKILSHLSLTPDKPVQFPVRNYNHGYDIKRIMKKLIEEIPEFSSLDINRVQFLHPRRQRDQTEHNTNLRLKRLYGNNKGNATGTGDLGGQELPE